MKEALLLLTYLLLNSACMANAVARDPQTATEMPIHAADPFSDDPCAVGFSAAARNGMETFRHMRSDYVRDEIIVKFTKTIANKIKDGRSKGRQLHDLKLSASLDRLRKKYKLMDAKAVFKNFKKRRQWIEALLNKDESRLTKKEKHILKRLQRTPKPIRVPNLDRIYKLKVHLKQGQTIKGVLAAYQYDSDVEYAELNYIVSIDTMPNDPYYPLQWALENTGQYYPTRGGHYTSGTSGADIDAPEAWDIHNGASGVVVAVVDTGVDYNHRDLNGNAWINESELNGTEGSG